MQRLNNYLKQITVYKTKARRDLSDGERSMLSTELVAGASEKHMYRRDNAMLNNTLTVQVMRLEIYTHLCRSKPTNSVVF